MFNNNVLKSIISVETERLPQTQDVKRIENELIQINRLMADIPRAEKFVEPNQIDREIIQELKKNELLLFFWNKIAFFLVHTTVPEIYKNANQYFSSFHV